MCVCVCEREREREREREIEREREYVCVREYSIKQIISPISFLSYDFVAWAVPGPLYNYPLSAHTDLKKFSRRMISSEQRNITEIVARTTYWYVEITKETVRKQ